MTRKKTDKGNSKTSIKWLKVWQRDGKQGDYIQKESSDDIIIPIMGPTGVGKSSFINAVTGRADATVGHELKSCTRDLQAVKMPMPLDFAEKYPRLSSRNIVLVDTPGFDDTYADDSEILRRISLWLASCYAHDVTVGGIVYMGDIAQKRMYGSTRTNLEMFEKLCGLKSYRHVVLVTTQWDTIQQKVGEAREQELRSTFWKEFIDRGATTFRATSYPGNLDGHHQILKHVIDCVDRRAYVADALLIQREFVEESKRIPLTEAGQKLKYTLEELLRIQQEAAADPYNDSRRAELDKKLQETKKQILSLKVTLSDRLKRWFGI
ncbi:P-loop containing nucleoside triphosphate hydrolase protein [Coprinopsis marcescibilis]|uniref:P-loop containing nucleoside triphosphate hydrolase protein n=1 Tax=Coprinopsis marcescibilis TaxID=230819 RepID=A0A5C3KU13_COPMA|nr:P-loop containing nucleoside triphosphate hydrolase protein [Coprinopsis marcescibilis]